MPNFAGATRGSTNDRGYGAPHQRLRKAAFAALPDGAPCCRCHRPMNKHAMEKYVVDGVVRWRSALHWDHNRMRDGYLGFSHLDCNRNEGAAEGGRRANAKRAQRYHPRPWRSRWW